MLELNKSIKIERIMFFISLRFVEYKKRYGIIKIFIGLGRMSFEGSISH